MARTVWLNGHHVDVGSAEHERLAGGGHEPQEPPYEVPKRATKEKLAELVAKQGFTVPDDATKDDLLGILGFPTADAGALEEESAEEEGDEVLEDEETS